MNKSGFDTVRMLMEKGLTVDEAVKEVESKLRCSLPEHLKVMIREQAK